MVCAGLQLIGFVLGVLSWIGMIATCASPEWRRNSRGGTIIDMNVRYEGLWTKCSLFISGQTKCSPYDSFFVGVPGVLQICRAMMIASLVLGLFAILITIYGIRCTSIGHRNPQAKARAAIIGGILFLVAAGLVGAAVSYYSHEEVVQEFYNPVLNKLPVHAQFQYGLGLFFGWASLVLGALGGGVLCFSSIHILKKINAINKLNEQTMQRCQRVQRHQNLPLTHHHRHTAASMHHNRIHGQPMLTKQRIAQHNANHKARNGPNHSAHTYANRHYPGYRHEKEAGKSVDRPQSKRIGSLDHLEGSSRQHRDHHRSEDTKSRPRLLKTPPKADDTDHRDNKNEARSTKDEDGGGHTRIRPENEYV